MVERFGHARMRFPQGMVTSGLDFPKMEYDKSQVDDGHCPAALHTDLEELGGGEWRGG